MDYADHCLYQRGQDVDVGRLSRGQNLEVPDIVSTLVLPNSRSMLNVQEADAILPYIQRSRGVLGSSLRIQGMDRHTTKMETMLKSYTTRGAGFPQDLERQCYNVHSCDAETQVG